MKPRLASAFPRKKFFLEMFTRDISLEDCILDLIDNSIDALIRTRNLDITANLLDPDSSSNGHSQKSLPSISISFSEREFKIVDKCGGIPRNIALTEVFNFGHTSNPVGGQLGAYGIGLKRAIFKIGNEVEIQSRTVKDGFETSITISEWAEKDDDIEDWTIPLYFIDGVASLKQAGTAITIKDLRPEVRMRLREGSIEKILRDRISQAYALFLERYVRVSLNNEVVEPDSIPIGGSNEVEVAKQEFEEGDVKVTLMASLAARNANDEWPLERGGWSVLCKGRVVVSADKTDLTGWGVGSPQFHYKYRGFVGVAFFQSDDPLSLPWTTTKRGLNRESPVYQKARNLMSGIARPVITFLNNMYPSEAAEQTRERQIAKGIQKIDIRAIAVKPPTVFKVLPPKNPTPRTVTIQFKAKIQDVERIKKCLREPTMSASRVGEHTFKHFLEKECPE